MARKLVIGNWKTHKTAAESEAFLRTLRAEPYAIDQYTGLDVILTPSFLAMRDAQRACEGSVIQLGAQNVDDHGSGSFCGGYPAALLREFCRYGFVGHSEQRLYYGDTDERINRRLLACLEAGLTPILCVGESREIYERGETLSHVRRQLERGLQSVTQPQDLILLYEPIWALGTGLHPDPVEIGALMQQIRQLVLELLGEPWREHLRFVYAGSIRPENAAVYASLPAVDGLAVGSASLDPAQFSAIVSAVSAL